MIIEAWARFFEDFDVLLTPSMPLAAFGTDVQSPANLTGCPATAVPTGFDEDGLPLGMQVICSPASRAWRWRVARENAIRGYGLDRVDVAG
jgi:Asp-tRNA(Asn)/Glu-tRNA(Gln) amidotransferase A subunit family amidase